MQASGSRHAKIISDENLAFPGATRGLNQPLAPRPEPSWRASLQPVSRGLSPSVGLGASALSNEGHLVVGPHADAADSRAGGRRGHGSRSTDHSRYHHASDARLRLLAVLHQTTTPVQSILGLVIGGGVPLIIATISRGAVGGGAVKLMAALGAALGWQNALYVFALSHVAGALVVLASPSSASRDRVTAFPSALSSPSSGRSSSRLGCDQPPRSNEVPSPRGSFVLPGPSIRQRPSHVQALEPFLEGGAGQRASVRTRSLFTLENTIYLYDLTSTYFEGQVPAQPAGPSAAIRAITAPTANWW